MIQFLLLQTLPKKSAQVFLETEKKYLLKSKQRVISIAAHCPITVAIAAPVIPNAGMCPIPKIKITSNMIFIIDPTTCAIIGTTIFPLA